MKILKPNSKYSFMGIVTGESSAEKKNLLVFLLFGFQNDDIINSVC